MTVQEEHDAVCVKLVREMTIEDLEGLRVYPWTQPGRILLLLRVAIAGRIGQEDAEEPEEAPDEATLQRRAETLERVKRHRQKRRAG